MKNNLFYLPILKYKTGEIRALQQLSSEIKKQVIPLVEFVKKEKQYTQGKKITYIPKPDAGIFRDDLQDVREKFPDMTIFVDTKLLTDVDRNKAVTSICQKVNLFRDKVYPVVYISELKDEFNKETNKMLKERGFCLRILGTELDELKTLSLNSSDKQNIHLVIDFGITDKKVNDVVPILMQQGFCENWKSISLASGSFPKDLSDFSAGEVGSQPRLDWLAWNAVRKQLDSLNYSLNYGDYTLRYPVFENLHNPNTSFSFRYTGDDKWFVFRGLSRKAKNFPGDIQYRAHAVTITENDQYQYSGENFSSGDTYIKSKAKLVDEKGNKLNKKCGSSTTWLQAGINHHITKVVHQLNDL